MSLFPTDTDLLCPLLNRTPATALDSKVAGHLWNIEPRSFASSFFAATYVVSLAAGQSFG
jgi:hypothetical protein